MAKKSTALQTSNAEEYVKKSVKKDDDFQDFSESMNVALKQKNEKNFFALILLTVVVVVLLLVSALSDILTLCFEVNRIFGYVMCGVMALLIIIFVIRPFCKVLGARYFITDVTNINKNLAKRKNAKALTDVAKSLLQYNEDPKNQKFRYVSEGNCENLRKALAYGGKENLRTVLRDIYGKDVGGFVNKLIFKNAGKVFLTTSISQNDKVDAISVLLVNLSMIKQIVAIYGYRPSFAKLFRIYLVVLQNTLVAYGMQNVNWFNVFGKFFTGVVKKVPFIDTVVDSAVQGTVNAFLTLLVGYKAKKYLCSDYKAQEKLEMADGEFNGDEEVEIASALAKKVKAETKTVKEEA